MSANDEFNETYEKTTPFHSWHDEDLASAARDGSNQARNALYLRHELLIRKLGGHARKILRIAIQSGRVNVIIEEADIEQQAFVVFSELLASWEPQSEPFIKSLKRRMPWRLREYVHDTLVGKRGDVSQKTLPLAIRADGTELHSLPLMSDDTDAAHEWGDHVKSLPFVLRKTVKLKYYDDLTSAEIASLTGYSRYKINKTLHSAIAILRQELHDTWEGT